MEKMSSWQEVCKLRWQTALIVPQPKRVLCTCWVCLESHFLPGTMSWPATLDTPRVSCDLLWIFGFLLSWLGEFPSLLQGLLFFGVRALLLHTDSDLGAGSVPSAFVGCWLIFPRYLFRCSLLESLDLPCQVTGRRFWSTGAVCWGFIQLSLFGILARESLALVQKSPHYFSSCIPSGTRLTNDRRLNPDDLQ